jgi:hypothetical protein
MFSEKDMDRFVKSPKRIERKIGNKGSEMNGCETHMGQWEESIIHEALLPLLRNNSC